MKVKKLKLEVVKKVYYVHPVSKCMVVITGSDIVFMVASVFSVWVNTHI